MKIKEILSQNRRDFTAIYVCEHCGKERKGRGYDDSNFHQKVIPAMKCGTCGKLSPTEYRPLATRYDDGVVV